MDPGQQIIETIRPEVDFFGNIRLERRDREFAIFQRDVQEMILCQQLRDFLKTLMQLLTPLLKILATTLHILGRSSGFPSFAGQQVLVEGQVTAATRHPDLSGAKPPAQLTEHAKLVISAIDLVFL